LGIESKVVHQKADRETFKGMRKERYKPNNIVHFERMKKEV